MIMRSFNVLMIELTILISMGLNLQLIKLYEALIELYSIDYMTLKIHYNCLLFDHPLNNMKKDDQCII